MFEAPLRIFISHGTHMEADKKQSSIDQGIQMAINDEDHHLCSCPYLSLVSG